eukprot:CAMPEP_0113836358 /NCGR_PEP_ID=MMETSP0328-20130328/9432_1 /TAXON_ID=39455 /ORGANISM="Alexandrium minutum" /LENGTH=56 /DNA_ID=CAMNT_0000804757 /DNA_START=1 /DNA_END=168 /DNA_ORIENTATION=+ /assembly_acc=CAM_ASM_000350
MCVPGFCSHGGKCEMDPDEMQKAGQQYANNDEWKKYASGGSQSNGWQQYMPQQSGG